MNNLKQRELFFKMILVMQFSVLVFAHSLALVSFEFLLFCMYFGQGQPLW